MKFGIFYELQLPRPWAAGGELKLYQDALTQLELADRCGYDYAWVVEHHFLEEYSHSPSPESFLAAASQRTRNIRLGHGIFQLTTNHPARVAERVAVLDLLSNGRVEFGMGESASITELTPFGRDMETKKEVFEEAVRAMFPMFRDGGSEHHGKYFDIPLRNVVPKPVQKPHPPLWMACSQLPTIERAGRNGFGAIGSPETIRRKLRRFRTSHIDQVILLNQAGKNSHEDICDSLELFATEVMPEFKSDPEHEQWKKDVMSGALPLEEIDTQAFTDRYG